MDRSRVDTLLRSVFNIQRDEVAKAVWMFVYLFGAVGAFVVGRISRASLFLNQWDRGGEVLAHMYYVSPLAVAGVAYVYSRVADSLRRDRLVMTTTGALFLGLLLVIQFGRALPAVIYYPGLYIYVEVMGMLLTLQFWTFANDVINAQQGKRMFGVIATGGVIASLICGQVVSKLSKRMPDVTNLLYVSAVGLLLCMTAVWVVGRRERMALDASMRRPRPGTGPGIQVGVLSERILSSAYLKFLAVMVCVTFLATEVADYQWHMMARRAFPDPAGLAGYMGNFYTVTSGLSLIFQIVATRSILKHFGIFTALLVLPFGLTAGTFVNLVAPGLMAVTLAKGSDTAFRYTINDSTVALLYLPIPGHQRGRVKAFIDGIVKFLARAVSGLALAFGFTRLVDDPSQLSWVVVGFLGLWFAVLIGIKPKYRETLLARLEGRNLDLADAPLRVEDESTARAVSRALHGDDEGRTLHMLEILPQLELKFEKEVAALLDHPATQVQLAAVREIGRIGGLRHAAAIKRLFEDDDVVVRAAAIDGYCAIGREKAIRDVAPFLDDPSPAIKAATIGGLVRYGGLDGVLCAAEELKKMVAHQDAEMRLYAARVLGAIGVRNFYQPLFQLLSDPDTGVRVAAIEAAGKMRSPELVPALILKLRHRAVARGAADALAAYGPGTEALLGKVLRFRTEDLEVRMAMPGILARIETQAAADVLQGVIERTEPNPRLRLRVYRALARLKHRNGALHLDRRRIEAAAFGELRYWFEDLQRQHDLGVAARSELLRDALQDRRDTIVASTFQLLAVLYPNGKMDTVHSNLSSANPALRSNAMEVIDNMVDKGLRDPILAMVEERPIADKLHAGQMLGVGAPHTATERFVELMTHEDPWVVTAALHAIVGVCEDGASPASEPHLMNLARDALSSRHAVVRQTALWALARIVPEDAVLGAAAARLAGDDEREVMVRAFAQALHASAGSALGSSVAAPAAG
jgi:AAA family ATP:ADP antiporter